MRIYSTEQLGPKQSLTPEGYLLCEAVPIARTGTQLYAAHELPDIEPGIDSLITVIREESAVFNPATMASFEGKPVTVGHTFVDPDSHSALAKGHLQNVRRGTGADSDLLVADVLITDAGTIGLVRVELDDKGRPVEGQIVLREVSCGYDADYVQERPGVAFQRNIIGNHLALVEKGRAGPRCSIQDEETMYKPNQPSLAARLLRAIRSGDTALMKRTADEAEEAEKEEKRAADEEAAEAEKKKTEDGIASLRATVDALTATVAALAKTKDSMGPNAGEASNVEPIDTGKTVGDEEPDEEEKKKTADSMRDFATRAEILVPGYKRPTTDAAPKRVADVVGVQRAALVAGLKVTDSAAHIAPLLAGRTVDALPDAEVGVVFLAASEMARAANNARGSRMSLPTADGANGKIALTNAAINDRNKSFWNQK